MEIKKEMKYFEKNYYKVTLSAKKFRRRYGCDVCKKDTATEAFLGWNGSVLWICGDCLDKINKYKPKKCQKENKGVTK